MEGGGEGRHGLGGGRPDLSHRAGGALPDPFVGIMEGGGEGRHGLGKTPEVLIALTRWVRLRLRAALWRQWKTPRRRRAALVANGVLERTANNAAGSGRGPWRLARSRALSLGLSNAHFRSLGLLSLFGAC